MRQLEVQVFIKGTEHNPISKYRGPPPAVGDSFIPRQGGVHYMTVSRGLLFDEGKGERAWVVIVKPLSE